jgi:hypothetical protein
MVFLLLPGTINYFFVWATCFFDTGSGSYADGYLFLDNDFGTYVIIFCCPDRGDVAFFTIN